MHCLSKSIYFTLSFTQIPLGYANTTKFTPSRSFLTDTGPLEALKIKNTILDTKISTRTPKTVINKSVYLQKERLFLKQYLPRWLKL